jgi:plasmid stabilization system protein ParE
MALSDVVVTGPGAAVALPRWMAGYEAQVVSEAQFSRLKPVPSVIVVRGRRPGLLLTKTRFLSMLDKKLQSGRFPTVVLEFEESARKAVDQAVQLVRRIEASAQVELAYGPESGRSALVEVEVKRLARERMQTSDALAKARSVVRATAVLRAGSGRLSAKSVAGAFGLSVAELAEILGTTRQRLAKTPDGKALQPLLNSFERVFRLRSVVPQTEFNAWLHQGNVHLDGESPLACIKDGECDVVADLVEDMLSGQPS